MNQFLELGDELDRESYDWLSETHPAICDAVTIAVARGASPEQVRTFVLRRSGIDREGLARRCEAAARHLGSK